MIEMNGIECREVGWSYSLVVSISSLMNDDGYAHIVPMKPKATRANTHDDIWVCGPETFID